MLIVRGLLILLRLWYCRAEGIVSLIILGGEEDLRDWRRGHHHGTAHGDLKLFGRWPICDRASWR